MIITDGTPDRDMRSLTLNSASDARNAGIGIIVVAVGERLNIDFYHDIAGVADRVIEIKYYDEILDNIIEILAVIQNFGEHYMFYQISLTVIFYGIIFLW